MDRAMQVWLEADRAAQCVCRKNGTDKEEARAGAEVISLWLRRTRDAALEEAAQVAEQTRGPQKIPNWPIDGAEIATAIRTLAEKQS